eukprot:3446182-Prymnesium_polylepis.2
MMIAKPLTYCSALMSRKTATGKMRQHVTTLRSIARSDGSPSSPISGGNMSPMAIMYERHAP